MQHDKRQPVMQDVMAGEVAGGTGACAARPAAHELLDTVLDALRGLPGYRSAGDDAVTRPDGVRVAIDRDAPLLTLGRLVQEDFCLLERRANRAEHLLTGAILCFPASWRLSDKFMRPLTTIHAPVADYDAGIARRVQRLFDAIRPGRPLWRANALRYHEAELFQPRRDETGRPRATAPYLRSERQCLVRLPATGAVVFSIHSYVCPVSRLSAEERAALDRQGPHAAATD